jgi:hypothetical protein
MKIKELMSNDSRCRRNTGLSIKKVHALVNKIEVLQKRADNKPKKNKPGAGRPCGFDLTEKVVLTLMYYRCYMTQACLGGMFGLSQSNASRIIGSVEPF